MFFYVKKDEVNGKGRKFSEVQGNRKIRCIDQNLMKVAYFWSIQGHAIV